MKEKIKKLPGSQVELEVTIDDKEFKAYWQPAYDNAASQVSIKGFRPGQAPKEMLAAAIDADKVFNAAINDAVKATLDELKIKHNWTLIDSPKIDVTDAKDLPAQAGGVTYKTVLTLFPEVELGNYKKIAKRILSERAPQTVSDDEITKALEWVRKSRAAVTLADHPAKSGDLVDIDLDVLSGGKPIPNTSFKGEKFVIGESHFIKGFDEALVGHKAGEQFEFSITAPADYWQKDLQGKQLDFKVKMNGVYDRAIPELNDTFASGLGPQFKTVEDLKKSVRDGLQQEKDEKETERLRLKLLNEIVKDSKYDLPQILVERTLDGLVSDMKRAVPADAAKSETALDKELREKLRERATQNVASHLVLYKIANVEKLTPTGDEVEAEASREYVDLKTHYDYIYGKLQNQKVFAFLDEQAKA